MNKYDNVYIGRDPKKDDHWASWGDSPKTIDLTATEWRLIIAIISSKDKSVSLNDLIEILGPQETEPKESEAEEPAHPDHGHVVLTNFDPSDDPWFQGKRD